MSGFQRQRKENETIALILGNCVQSAEIQHFPMQPVKVLGMERNVKESVCRLCLGEDVEVIYAFESRRLDGWTAADGITELLGMQVLEDDEYPHRVCIDCIGKLEDFKVFKGICERSKRLLDRAYAGKRGDTGRKEAAVDVLDLGSHDIDLRDDHVSTALERDPLELSEDNVELRNIDSPLVPVKLHKVINSERVPFITVKTAELYDKGETVNNDIQSNFLGESVSEELMPVREGQCKCISNESDVACRINEGVVHIPTEVVNNELLEEEKPILFEYPDGRVPADESTSVGDEISAVLSETFLGYEPKTSRSINKTCVRQLKKIGSQPSDTVAEFPKPKSDNRAGPTCVSGASRIINEDKFKDLRSVPTNVEGSTVKSSQKIFSCSLCSKEFPSESKLQRHAIDHLGGREFHCNKCGKKFSRKDKLRVHLSANCEDRQFVCSLCDRAYSKRGNLKLHMVSHSGDRPFKCGFCDKAFSHSSDLKKHTLVHTGDRPYKCAECGKAFSQMSNLYRHMLTHSGDWPFKCTLCDKAFRRKDNLKNHMMSHSAETPFMCNVCCETFCKEVSLQEHELTHSRRRSFKCGECNEAFVQLSNLKAHMCDHSLERPFKCHECSKRFSHKGHLAIHVKIHS